MKIMDREPPIYQNSLLHRSLKIRARSPTDQTVFGKVPLKDWVLIGLTVLTVLGAVASWLLQPPGYFETIQGTTVHEVPKGTGKISYTAALMEHLL